MKECENCGSRMGHHGCTWCNEESYIVDQYKELGMALPHEDTEFMIKYNQQQEVHYYYLQVYLYTSV